MEKHIEEFWSDYFCVNIVSLPRQKSCACCTNVHIRFSLPSIHMVFIGLLQLSTRLTSTPVRFDIASQILKTVTTLSGHRYPSAFLTPVVDLPSTVDAATICAMVV
jgi:hypothetical protein